MYDLVICLSIDSTKEVLVVSYSIKIYKAYAVTKALTEAFKM